MAETGKAAKGGGFLGAVERFGDRLPDPVFIFVWLIAILMAFSALAAFLEFTAIHPITGETLMAQSLFSRDNVQRLLTSMPQTLTGFAPLGLTLVIMLGAGVAERSGLFSAGLRAGLRNAPKAAMTPIVMLLALVATHSSDAAYVVLIPLSGVIYASVGRHPIAGIAAAFAGVSGGFSANFMPGPIDALILGVTEPAAQILDPSWSMNVAGNWFFILGMAAVFFPIGWFVTDRIIEPRLGTYTPKGETPISSQKSDSQLSPEERRGLWYALGGFLAVTGLWLWLTFGPGTYLQIPGAPWEERLNPMLDSLIAYFFLLFLICGVCFGIPTKTIKSHRDVVRMSTEAMKDMSGYIVLAFTAAHFVVMLNWTGLGAIAAIHGAGAIQTAGLPAPLLLAVMVLLAAGLNLVVGSASAKWAFMAPFLVPMLMILGISPEMATAAYRVGDSVTNIITPLMVYFPMVLAFCRRWDPDFGMGGLLANMLPYSFAFLIGGLTLTIFWVWLGIPVGPGAPVTFVVPDGAVLPEL
ncbi:AbgT family transporter [Alkalicaulis satelles]|uniref:AbgT family transporter n=1 Tax=Alkalicaulis satelles TaxID=2609175 RepID=A0A5M6ZJP5_9PROT|nr:AbgT family transporter [Alkalicaulis satelles]KAA5805036.1 AbgT family transporter [Alkalicaulis satelles]